MSLTNADIQVLSAPFPKDKVGFKVQVLSQKKDKALIVAYLQHTDVYGRIEKVDMAWHCETISTWNDADTHYAHTRLTIRGVTRDNVGDGNDPKGAFSDALKRCAMLFGVGRYLYDSETVWVPYNESTDKYKSWTYDDYNRGLRKNQDSLPIEEDVDGASPKHDPAPTTKDVPGAPVPIDDDIPDFPIPEDPEEMMLKSELRRAIHEIVAKDKTKDTDSATAFVMQNDKVKFGHIEMAHTKAQLEKLERALATAKGVLKSYEITGK